MAGIPAGHLERSIARALAGRSKLSDEVLALSGHSTLTLRHFLNNLCSFPSANFLEIGTFTGSTLISASYRNQGRFTAIDNFAWSPPTRKVFRRVEQRFKDWCRFDFHDADCWNPSLLAKLPRRINVYFFDGPHSFEDHYRAFADYDPVLAREFLAVVDDWDFWPIRKATRDAFAFLRYRCVEERELSTRNMPAKHWGNGLYVALVRKRRAPPAPKSRRRGAQRQPR